MAIWKVSVERIALFDHPNADRMQLGKVGMHQLVVARSNGYRDGDLVVFAPARAVLPPDLRGHYTNSDTGRSYLLGKDHDRVGQVTLRGALSEGVTLPPEYVCAKLGVDSLDALPVGEDLAARLGITKYEPPIPLSMAGQVRALADVGPRRTHDVEQFAIYQSELVPGEPVVVTEKIHGSQCALLVEADGTAHVSSKGFFAKGIEIVEDAVNLYWRAVRETGLVDVLREAFPGRTAQAFGEAFPCQGGAWTYGADGNRPTLRVFRVVVDGHDLSLREAWAAAPKLQALWAPVLYEGPYDPAAVRPLAEGRECVSGRALHIKEGVVLAPATPRRSREGFALLLKVLNSKYAEADDALS